MRSSETAKTSSWIDVASSCDFPIQNLPYGVFRRGTEPARVGVAIGEKVLDLAALHQAGSDTGILRYACSGLVVADKRGGPWSLGGLLSRVF